MRVDKQVAAISSTSLMHLVLVFCYWLLEHSTSGRWAMDSKSEKKVRQIPRLVRIGFMRSNQRAVVYAAFFGLDPSVMRWIDVFL